MPRKNKSDLQWVQYPAGGCCGIAGIYPAKTAFLLHHWHYYREKKNFHVLPAMLLRRTILS